jgi:ParB/RepB/Spo0J family partition protein
MAGGRIEVKSEAAKMTAACQSMHYIEEITIPDGRMRHRLDEQTVENLMTSIRDVGLLAPIIVRWVEIEDDGDNALHLVAGRHRLEAMRRLGHEKIACCELATDDDRDARLTEIVENLHRAELTDAERREHINEWVRLTADKLPHDAAVSGRGLAEGRGNEGAISKAAKSLGLSKDTIQRNVALYPRRRLPPTQSNWAP